MANPNPPLQAPKESFARGYKLVWRLLLISNLALGAYIISRPRKNDTVKKGKKAMTKSPIAPLDTATSSKPESDQEATISGSSADSATMNEPISDPENRWPKVFKW